jgi:RHS repeat-associated protein
LEEITYHVARIHEVPPPAEPDTARADPLTVTLAGTAAGTVTSNPAGISCGGSTVSCTGWFPEGSQVILTASPDAGQVFLGWTGGCTSVGPLTGTIDSLIGPTSVRAVFGSPLEFYHLDVLGSVRMVTNAAGAVVKRHDYFAFGEDIQGPTGDPRRFTGKERDVETELHYFGARYYRSVWGRFTSVDPHSILAEARTRAEFKSFIQNPQSWNRYAYVENRPLVGTDSDGRCLPCAAYAAAAALVRYGPQVVNMAKQVYHATVRVIGSPAGREVAETIAGAMVGYDGPSLNPTSAVVKGLAVIGPRETYVEHGKKIGAKVFELAAGEAYSWEKNQKWLDSIIGAGYDVVFGGAFKPWLLDPDSALAKEISYLISKGYEWTPDFTRLVKK